MQYPRPRTILSALSLICTAAVPARGGSAKSYIDVDTGTSFFGHVEPSGYLFGMMTPQQPTTDFIAQLVVPLTNGAGWGGVSLGSSMNGPLLLVTWPDGDKVMTAARVASGYTPSAVIPYTTNPIALSPIAQGTFVNSTHVSSTFLCAGCINADSFDPAWADDEHRDVFFGYAYSQTAVDDPSDIDTRLSDHTAGGAAGSYGDFPVVLANARSNEYDQYAAMAGADGRSQAPTSSATSTAVGSATSTAPPRPAATSDGEIPPLELVVLVVLGAVYLLQPFIA
ncbi:hypothetical protein C8A01DRAFT_50642 [Parachaetomium inaequale]|uniref:Cellobiose dehydrogenase-like cytochrome domain-containing protein n=1 Tax=Parachaetomium inaequale TaxID=2588326 RepID=A0AAN6P863_9PEZI|nr:hypothetical protein C8A01DRAFT_50642 [Parachaetomium inaequale]